MAVNANITLGTTTKVVLDSRLWMGTPADSTAWLNGIAGVAAGQAEGGVNLLVVDLTLTDASTATVFSLDDVAATKVAGVNGTKVLAILGLHNNSDGLEIPLMKRDGATVAFTSPSGTNTDVITLSLLYV